jgi:hypothetical protein
MFQHLEDTFSAIPEYKEKITKFSEYASLISCLSLPNPEMDPVDLTNTNEKNMEKKLLFQSINH